MQTGAALEQLREVIAILRELGNAGPRDQSFKQWRQVTMTLLQRIWPDNQGNAARFRRIPFSPPSSRADVKTVRECYERGVCEAIAYLEGLVEELENGTSRLNRKLVRPAEAPRAETLPASPPEPERVAEPGRFAMPERFVEPELEILPPGAPLEPPPPRPAPPAPDSFLTPFPATRPTPESAAPERAADVAPAAPPQAAATPPAREKSTLEKVAGRSKQRLKDMLGFGDENPSPSAAPAVRPPASRAAPPAPLAPPPPPVAAAPTPAAPAPVAPIERFEPPAPPVAREPAAPVQVRPAPVEPPAPPVEPAAESAPWSAPVIPFPMHKVVVGRPSAPPPPEPFEDDAPEEAFDLDFDLADDDGPNVEAPPTTLREMLDRPESPRAAETPKPAETPRPVQTPRAAEAPRAAAPNAAREVLAMASEVDRLGVPRGRRAIVRAALIDLGHQLESPPVHWAAMRQAMAFMLDYPQIARRVIPMLLPYLDEAA